MERPIVLANEESSIEGEWQGEWEQIKIPLPPFHQEKHVEQRKNKEHLKKLTP
jgi:hypothetical protein